jgi:hypothetical protein
MAASASFMQVATVANALLWPLAAGAAVIGWSRLRAARARRRAAADRRLREAYRSVEAQGVPPRLAAVVEALEDGGRAARARRSESRSDAPADC